MKKQNSKKRRTRNSLSKEEILDAAESILNTEGIKNLSMRKIAIKLSCSVASPYAYFESIEDIAKGLVQRGEETLKKMIKEYQEKAPEDSFSQLEAIARAYWAFARTHRELHKIMFQIGEGIIHRKVIPVMPYSYRTFLSIIKRGIETGEFKFRRKDYPALARTMWSWMYGLIMLDLTQILHLSEEKNDPLEEGITFFQELLRQGWSTKKEDDVN